MSEKTGALLQVIHTVFYNLPPNATHLVQTADYFIIEKLKYAWRVRWDENKYAHHSGVLDYKFQKSTKHRQKNIFKIAAAAVLDSNGQRGKMVKGLREIKLS